ncbi:MAG: ATP-binding protein [Peptoniphilaceae bacterium]
MNKSLGNRLVRSFLTIIIFTVVVINFFLIIGFKQFYYSNVENELKSRLLVSIDSFNKFYADKSLEKIVLEDTDLIWAHSNSEVQLLDKDGYVLLDTIGALPTDPINTEDVLSAKTTGDIKSYVGKNIYTNSSNMSITGPLKSKEGNVIGYIRFISSLENINKDIIKTSSIIIFFGVVVVLITAIMSIIIATTIVKPIKELTKVAEKMADGQYKVRSNLDSEDELGQLSNTLNTMAEEILKKEQIKNDFISSISHELRTPLTSIKGWAVVLKTAKEDEKKLIEDGLTIIENESDRLAKMVEELLDFSRFISGRIQLEKDKFNIADTCGDVAKQMKPRAISNKVDFITEVEDVKAIIIGDENRIRQLLINLLDNAIKFTMESGWVKLKSYISDNNYIILVSDNGLGISKSDLNHVKEKFYKGKHSKSHSGIGLSISDEITRLHGGKLEIFSEKNIGTTVKVTIPISEEVKEIEDE